jgi:hypothetical protein
MKRFAQSFRSSATAPAWFYLLHNPHGWGECREMTGSFPVHAVVLMPLTYIPVGNAEDERKDKSVARVIKFTFLKFEDRMKNASLRQANAGPIWK